MNNIPGEIAKKIFKDTLIKHGYNTINSTINKAANSIRKDINTTLQDPIISTVNTVVNAPATLQQELKRQSYHEASNNFNVGNYDYFGEYYSSYAKRYNPTPQNNLAEVLWLREQHNRKIRGY